jgi:hypothetical protein
MSPGRARAGSDTVEAWVPGVGGERCRRSSAADRVRRTDRNVASARGRRCLSVIRAWPRGLAIEHPGTLGVYDYNWATGAAVGTARLLLSPNDHLAATLWTFDGNDYFQIGLEVGGYDFVLGDPESLGVDEFE